MRCEGNERRSNKSKTESGCKSLRGYKLLLGWCECQCRAVGKERDSKSLIILWRFLHLFLIFLRPDFFLYFHLRLNCSLTHTCAFFSCTLFLPSFSFYPTPSFSFLPSSTLCLYFFARNDWTRVVRRGRSSLTSS